MKRKNHITQNLKVVNALIKMALTKVFISSMINSAQAQAKRFEDGEYVNEQAHSYGYYG